MTERKKMYPYNDATYSIINDLSSFLMQVTLHGVIITFALLVLSKVAFLDYKKVAESDMKTCSYNIGRVLQRFAVLSLIVLIISSFTDALLLNVKLQMLYERFGGSISGFVSAQRWTVPFFIIAGAATAALVAVLLNKPWTSYAKSEDKRRDQLEYELATINH